MRVASVKGSIDVPGYARQPPGVAKGAPVNPEKADVSPFGQEMRERRQRCRYTQKQLATLVGCSRSAIAMVETGGMDSFTNEAVYAEIAKVLGGTAPDWKALADRGKLAFSLAGAGDGITEEHRRTGALMAQHWPKLSPAALRAFRQVIAHELSKATV